MTTATMERQCRHCGYVFVPRVAYPKRCPDCHLSAPLGKPKG